jgi:hypothetical protein
MRQLSQKASYSRNMRHRIETKISVNVDVHKCIWVIGLLTLAAFRVAGL